ncbi:MAG: hypothetical protein IKI41_00570, partial [Clostridia bacterium]|nr:hypothetical protein [Clostridia bacterium]
NSQFYPEGKERKGEKREEKMGSEWKPSRNRWSETELVKWWLERAESYSFSTLNPSLTGIKRCALNGDERSCPGTKALLRLY